MEKHIVNVFKTLADENRLKILRLLIQGQSCGCVLIDQLTITQPTLSYHLKALRKAGLVSPKKEGTKINYLVNRDVLDEIIGFFLELKQTQFHCESSPNIEMKKEINHENSFF